jgi:hypothetical protein
VVPDYEHDGESRIAKKYGIPPAIAPTMGHWENRLVSGIIKAWFSGVESG